MTIPQKKEAGFTLIELLVVISIISILSSTILVSVSTTKVKAKNIQTMNNISSYINAFELSRSPDGQFVKPAVVGGTYFNCLGTGYVNATCWQNGSSAPEDSYLNSILSQYFPTLPIDKETHTMSGRDYTGTIYRCGNPISGRCDSVLISWFYKGDARNLCNISGLKSVSAIYDSDETNCSGWYPTQPPIDNTY